jgi:Ca2+-binding RTX toxin-like protein
MIAVQDVSPVTIVGSSKDDLIDATHTVAGQPFPTIEGDTISGLGGSDTIDGLAGNDTISGGQGVDHLSGGDGDDTFLVTGNQDTFDTFDGGSGTDTLQVTGNGALMLAGFDAVASSIEVWTGNGHQVNGTSGADMLDFSELTAVSNLPYVDAGNGNDTVFGSKFADDLRGGAGNDTIDGFAGNDTISGGAGNDQIFGGHGDDTILVTGTQDTFDIVDGGPGTDTLQVAGKGALTLAGFDATASSIEVWAGNGNQVDGTAAAEAFNFSGLTSVGGLKNVDGGGGDDTIVGSNFADDLRGGAGNDTLNGGGGSDLLAGGKGADTFVYGPAGGADTVTDLQFQSNKAVTPGKDDLIDLSGWGFSDYTADVHAKMSQAGKNVVIDFGGGNTLQINHTTIAALDVHHADFLL